MHWRDWFRQIVFNRRRALVWTERILLKRLSGVRCTPRPDSVAPGDADGHTPGELQAQRWIEYRHPFKNDRYYALRPEIGIPKKEVLPLDNDQGLHPSQESNPCTILHLRIFQKRRLPRTDTKPFSFYRDMGARWRWASKR